MAESEPGTFYLTDFLAQHFERFVIKPLKLDTHPELRDSYFGNYRRLVFLSQTQSAELLQAANEAAVNATLADLADLEPVSGVHSVIRVVGGDD